MLKKKGLTLSFLIYTIILIFSFILLLQVIKTSTLKAKPATAEAICQATVAAQEKTKINLIIKDVQPVPKICPIIRVEAKSPEEVYEYMARCKKMYGFFLIYDVFKKGIPSKLNCRPCFLVTTKKSDKFEKKEENTPQKIVQDMSEKVYYVEEDSDNCHSGGGFCRDSKEECDLISDRLKFDDGNADCVKKGCCYSSIWTCLNKGGKCEDENYKNEEYRMYDKWKCPSGKTCFVHKNNYYTYLEYIQFYRGQGVTAVLTPIKQNEKYLISYGAPTKECKYCDEYSIYAGAATFAIVAIATKGIGLIPVLAGIGVGATSQITTTTVENALSGRDDHTIYLSTYKQLIQADSCNVLDEP